MNILDITKRIAANPLVRHGESGHWMSSYDPDSVAVARELMRLLDNTPATPEWILESCDCAWSVEGGALVAGDVHLSSDGELTIGNCTVLGPVSRGFMRRMMMEMGVEIKEGER